MPCVSKVVSPGFFVAGLFTNEFQKTILMVIHFAVDRPSLIGSHSQITFTAPYRTFGMHGTSFVPSPSQFRLATLRERQFISGLSLIFFADRFLSSGWGPIRA